MTHKRETSRRDLSPLAAGATALGSFVAGLATGWIVYSHFGIDHEVELPEAVPAERERLHDPQAGLLSYYVDKGGTGAPLVLLHSINAAASAFEMRPLFQHYRDLRPTYALDLPGYGFSERSERTYTPGLFTQAILALLQTLDEPADVVALSLTSEFAARAALQAPELFRTLTLISPTGFQTTERADPGSETAHSLLSFPLWARPLFDLLGTRGSIRYYLQKSFAGDVPDAFVEYAYATAHRPGAHHAPLYFLSGLLFSANVRSQLYAKVSIPVLVLFDKDPYVRFEALRPFTATRSNWQAQRIAPTRGLPHFEQLADTTHALDTFWS